jgi:hypothetical protein
VSVLDERVFAGGRTKRFGEMTADEVKARAAELKSTAGWGPTARVAAVAIAWAELARQMDTVGARTVAELDPQAVDERAERLWVVPPGGSLLL